MDNSHELLKYYESYFPYTTWYQWLNHSPVPGGTDFMNREFAFTINTGKDSDVYTRWQSFPTFQDFKSKVMVLAPKRFEIGAVYTRPPVEHKRVAPDRFKPVSKELVFDIDMTDYDAYRTCCSGKQVCVKCWQFINAAIDVLNATFTEDFGYEHVMWAFSGRRGVHAWICDERARLLDDQQRVDLLDYLTITFSTGTMASGHVSAGSSQLSQLSQASQSNQSSQDPNATIDSGTSGGTLSRPFHPMLERSLNILKKRFEEVVLVNQDPWRSPEQIEMLTKRLWGVGPEYVTQIRTTFTENTEMTGVDRWQELDKVAQQLGAQKANAAILLKVKQDLILEWLYPKLDVNVSKSRQHLLKSPFCVHPDTGNVCVPMLPQSYTEFDPNNVPTIAQLLAEKKAGIARSRGSLEPYLHQFRTFVGQLNRGSKRSADSMDF